VCVFGGVCVLVVVCMCVYAGVWGGGVDRTKVLRLRERAFGKKRENKLF